MMDHHEYLFLKRWGVKREEVYSFAVQMLFFACLGVVAAIIYHSLTR